jgi:S-methylmethionine-dependent homocysteine/selenocysteine methylase
MRRIYLEYFAAGADHALPMLVSAPTWRCQRDRVHESAWHAMDVNGDAVRWLKETAHAAGHVTVGALLGPRGDCYRPEQALPEKEAASWHAWQVERLVDAGADFLLAATLPACSEAVGLARAMSAAHVPCFVSFVLASGGLLLDGTEVAAAIRRVDDAAAPLGFLFNCTHPLAARRALQSLPPNLADRVWGLQANTSPRSHTDLENAAELETEDAASFAPAVYSLRRDFGLRILGGCCGTDASHIRALAALLKTGR